MAGIDHSQRKLLLIAGLAVAAVFLVPQPAGVGPGDWPLLWLFAATIAGILVQPYPIAVVLFLSLGIGASLGILTLQQTLAGYSSAVTWIILSAFMFARAFIKTGLGRRIALLFIRSMGHSSLRLGYALSLTDLVLAPVTASNTARTGGILFPVVRSLASEFESEPGPTARRIGSYILFTAFQANVITSATFLTAMSANGISVALAAEVAGVNITWGLWLYASAVPAALSLLITPWIIHRLYPPELQDTSHAVEYARDELHKLGPMDRNQRILVFIFVILALTWATSSFHSVPSVAAALAAISALLITGVLEISDVAGERSAWETYIWFGGVVSLAGALTASSLIDLLVEAAGGLFGGMHGITALVLLVVAYVYIHYGFASMTAHIIALYGAFLGLAVGAGAPPLVSALCFAFFSNLYATTTHYGDGAAPIYYGSGYIALADWWRVGFVLSVAHLAVWLGIGLPLWKLLGIW